MSIVYIVLFLIFCIMAGLRGDFSSVIAKRRKMIRVAEPYLLKPVSLFGDLSLANSKCIVSVKWRLNVIKCMSKVYDADGQKKMFRAECLVMQGYQVDDIFNAIGMAFDYKTTYEDIRSACVAYSILEESVYESNPVKSSAYIEESKPKSFSPKKEGFKKVDSVDLALEGVLLDVNVCSEEEFLRLPGINAVLAKKIIRFRETKRFFSSKEDFIETMKIKPHFAKKIMPHICAMSFTDGVGKKKNSEGRVVDF